MRLQRAKNLINEAGRLVAEEGLNSPESGEFLFEAIAGLTIAKNALQREIKERARQDNGSEPDWSDPRYAGITKFFKERYGWSPDGAADSGALPEGSGVDGRDACEVQVPGAPQAHEPKSQE